MGQHVRPVSPPLPASAARPQSLAIDIDAIDPDGADHGLAERAGAHPHAPPKRRGGFDTAQLHDLSFSSSDKSAESDQAPTLPSLAPVVDLMKRLFSQQSVYKFLENTPVMTMLVLLMATDFCCCACFMSVLIHARHSPVLDTVYIAVDWLTAIVYFVEVHLLMYGYGTTHYFQSVVRASEYGLSMGNAAGVVALYLTMLPSLQIVRFLRLLRILSTCLRWRERHIKWRTRTDLEHVAELLYVEQDVQSNLVNWKIDSDAILMGKQAGQGGFGTVFSGLFRGTLVAVKHLAFPKGAGASEKVEDEAVMLVNLRHPNVILFMGFVHEPSRLWIVTEYCSRGSLRDVLDRGDGELNQARLLKIALGAARGLAYLHGQSTPVMHLDLKTSNILISAGWDAKIGDFGLSRNIEDIQNDSFSGTMQYCAPEILRANEFSIAADVYSFGICLWEMAIGTLPFEGLSPTEVLWGVVKNSLRPDISSVTVCCLQKDGPGSMYSATTIEKAIAPAIRNLKEERLAAVALARQAEEMGEHEVDSQWFEKSVASKTQEVAMSPLPVQRAISTLENTEGMTPSTHNARLTSNANYKKAQSSRSRHSSFRRSLPSGALMEEPISFPSDMSSLTNIRSVLSEQVYGNLSSCMSPPSPSRIMADDTSIFSENTSSPTARNRMRGLSKHVSETIQRLDDRPVSMRLGWGDDSSETPSPRTERSVRSSLFSPKRESMSSRRQYSRKANVREPDTDASGKNGSNAQEENVSPFERRLTVFSQHSMPLERRCSSPAVRKEGAPGAGGFNADEEAPLGVGVPQEYVELIKDCWAQDPRERPTAGEVVWRLVMLINEGRVAK